MEVMSGLDAKFLYSETPTAHMHTIKVAVSDVSEMEGGFSYDTFVEVLGQLLVRLPPFRRRTVPVPWGLGHPVWIEDPDFDLTRHVSRRVLAGEGGDHQLAAMIAEFAGTPLARDRPLWELVVVEGLDCGRIAVVAKIHHAVADGSAAVALLRNVVEGATIKPSAEPIEDDWSPEPVPSTRQLLVVAGHDHLKRLKGLPHFLRESVTRATASERRRRRLSVRPPLPLHHIPKTSFNVSLTPERTFAMTNLSMDEMKAIRRSANVTFNDVYLCVCAGALRRYLSDRGEVTERQLVASVPVSTDPDAARMLGNRVDNLYVGIGTDLADPRRRLQHIHKGAAAAKEVRAVLGHNLLEQRADIIPPQIYRATVRMWSRSHLADRVEPPLNVVLSNVAGPRERMVFGSIELEHLYSVGPILEGIGLNITAWSYEDALGVSVLGCPVSIPDPWLIIDALHESLAELRDAVSGEPLATGGQVRRDSRSDDHGVSEATGGRHTSKA
jgi:diacylglycerol O-acyltransferase